MEYHMPWRMALLWILCRRALWSALSWTPTYSERTAGQHTTRVKQHTSYKKYKPNQQGDSLPNWLHELRIHGLVIVLEIDPATQSSDLTIPFIPKTHQTKRSSSCAYTEGTTLYTQRMIFTNYCTKENRAMALPALPIQQCIESQFPDIPHCTCPHPSLEPYRDQWFLASCQFQIPQAIRDSPNQIDETRSVQFGGHSG